MNLYFVVVAPCDKKRLLLMKVDAPDRPIVLVELVDHGAHTVVP